MNNNQIEQNDSKREDVVTEEDEIFTTPKPNNNLYNTESKQYLNYLNSENLQLNERQSKIIN